MKKMFLRGGKKWNKRCMLCLLPSVIGMVVFFLFPFFRVCYYSCINNQFQKKFVFLENYKKVLENPYFRLAMKNSLLLIGIGVPIVLGIALLLSFLFSFSLKKYGALLNMFVFPMFIPTASVVPVWQRIFEGNKTAFPVYALFIWKNLGICIIMLTAAFTTIDSAVYEAAKLDGAGGMKIHLKISLPLIIPSFLFNVLLCILNSFRVFKESFLYYGSQYPPSNSYTLQYYMNNHFLKFDYQSLAVCSVCTSVIILALIFAGLMLQRRFQS